MKIEIIESENKALLKRANKLDSEITKKLQASKILPLKFIDKKMFNTHNKSFQDVKSNLFKPKNRPNEAVLRELLKECTFKPVIARGPINGYTPIINRLYQKKETILNNEINENDFNELVKTQDSSERYCLPESEWEKKEKVRTNHEEKVITSESVPIKTKKKLNPNFYEEKIEWLREINNRIRIEQLTKDEAIGKQAETENVPDLEKKAKNEETFNLRADFFKRLEEKYQEKFGKLKKIELSAYNFNFHPVTNNNYCTVKSKFMSKTLKLAKSSTSAEQMKSPKIETRWR